MAQILNTLNEAHKSFAINGALIAATAKNDAIDQNVETTPENIIAAMNDYFNIAKSIDEQHKTLTPSEITDVGEQGLILISTLIERAKLHNLIQEKTSLEQVAVVVAQWIINHQGRINVLENIVDGLAHLGNTLKEKTSLIDLSIFMGQIIEACSDQLKHDLEATDPHRPWRILNINHGIVATRTHDVEIMHNVFNNLTEILPLDAPDFFKEGMSEMTRLGYPDHVCQVMQEFHTRTNLPTIH